MHRPAALTCFETASETAPSASFFLKAFPANSPSRCRCCPSRKCAAQLPENVSKRPRNPPLQHLFFLKAFPSNSPPGCCCCPSRKRAFLHFRRTRRMARRNMASRGLCLPVMRARGAVTTDHNSCSSGSSSVRPLMTGATHASRPPCRTRPRQRLQLSSGAKAKSTAAPLARPTCSRKALAGLGPKARRRAAGGFPTWSSADRRLRRLSAGFRDKLEPRQRRPRSLRSPNGRACWLAPPQPKTNASVYFSFSFSFSFSLSLSLSLSRLPSSQPTLLFYVSQSRPNARALRLLPACFSTRQRFAASAKHATPREPSAPPPPTPSRKAASTASL